MLRSFVRLLSRLVLGPAAQAGRQELDADARLAMAPRDLENHAGERRGDTPPPRRVGHFLVYEGGRQGAGRPGSGPLGRPTPVTAGGRKAG